MTAWPGFAGTCQTMTFSSSAVVRKCSSASGKPAASGVVRSFCGIGKTNERCTKNNTARPTRYPTNSRATSHFRMVMSGRSWLAVIASHPLDDILGHLLGVAEQHHGVVTVEQGIVDAGIARCERALDEHHGAGLPDLQYRHAVDRRFRIVLGGRIGDVVGADHEGDVRLGEFRID